MKINDKCSLTFFIFVMIMLERFPYSCSIAFKNKAIRTNYFDNEVRVSTGQYNAILGKPYEVPVTRISSSKSNDQSQLKLNQGNSTDNSGGIVEADLLYELLIDSKIEKQVPQSNYDMTYHNITLFKIDDLNKTCLNITNDIQEHVENIKNQSIKKFIPVYYPVPIERRINIPVRVPIKVPQRVLIPEPVPYRVKVPVPYPVKVEVPQIKEVIKEIFVKVPVYEHIPVFHHFSISDESLADKLKELHLNNFVGKQITQSV